MSILENDVHKSVFHLHHRVTCTPQGFWLYYQAFNERKDRTAVLLQRQTKTEHRPTLHSDLCRLLLQTCEERERERENDLSVPFAVAASLKIIVCDIDCSRMTEILCGSHEIKENQTWLFKKKIFRSYQSEFSVSLENI